MNPGVFQRPFGINGRATRRSTKPKPTNMRQPNTINEYVYGFQWAEDPCVRPNSIRATTPPRLVSNMYDCPMTQTRLA